MVYMKTTTSGVIVAFCGLLLSGQACLGETAHKLTATSGTKVQLDDGVEIELVAVSAAPVRGGVLAWIRVSRG